MSSDPAPERSYSKGLLLGFTLSEIALLLVFVLLLAMGAAFSREHSDSARRIEDLRRELAQANASLAATEAKNRELAEREAAVALVRRKIAEAHGAEQANRFDDLFQELVLAGREREKTRNLESEAAALREKARQLDEVAEAARQAAGEAPGADEGLHKVMTMLASLRDLRERLEQLTALSGPEAARQVREMLKREQEYSSRLSTMQARIKSLQGEIRSQGKGASYPPCWISPATGKAEYLFDVVITDAGVKVRDGSPPHRAGEKARLPLQNVRFGELHKVEAFLASTQALAVACERENCRHYVRLYDETSTKSAFKSQMLAIETQFYKYLTSERFSP